MTILEEDILRITQADLSWKDLTGKRVLVTGAAGFLPAYMVETLLCVDADVSVLGRLSVLDRYAGYPVTLLLQDVCDTIHGKYDYVIHAASPASPKFYKTNPVETLLANTRGTENALNACERGGKFLYFSSGDASHCHDTLDPRSCYGESKRMGEVMCAAWKAQHGVDAKIARISHTYGPGMKLDDGRVFADFTRDILNGGPITLHSNGSAIRPFLYLADATLAFFTILLKDDGNWSDGLYNVANPHQNMSICMLANRLANEFNLDVQYAPHTPTPYSVAGPVPLITRLEALGWTPTTTIEEGFRRTVRSYAD
jgi:UDP-glucuronate decarboxylase